MESQRRHVPGHASSGRTHRRQRRLLLHGLLRFPLRTAREAGRDSAIEEARDAIVPDRPRHAFPHLPMFVGIAFNREGRAAEAIPRMKADLAVWNASGCKV